jgi:hypothetical protein
METKAHRARMEAMVRLDLKDRLVLLALRVLTAMKVYQALMGTKAHRALTEATAQLGLKDRLDQQEIWALMETMARTVKTVRTQTSSSLAPKKPKFTEIQTRT